MKFLSKIFKQRETTNYCYYELEYEHEYVDVRLKSKYDYAGTFQKTINVRMKLEESNELKSHFKNGRGYADIKMNNGYMKTIDVRDIRELEILYDNVAYKK